MFSGKLDYMPTKRIKIGLLTVLLGLGVGCMTTPVTDTFTQAETPLTFTTSTGVVVVQAYVADTAAEQAQGLGAITNLAPEQAMLFMFTQPTEPTFWMKDVEYPIDIVWVKDNSVVGIAADVPPERPSTPLANYQRYSPPQPVTWVVELSAGQAAQLGVTVGATVSL